MFDDFDMRVCAEELTGYDAEEAFCSFYGVSFEDYCDELEREKRVDKEFLDKDFYDKV